MIKIVTIIGARPQIIKAAALEPLNINSQQILQKLLFILDSIMTKI